MEGTESKESLNQVPGDIQIDARDYFDFRSKLGEGGFGGVYEALDIKS